MSKGKRMTFQGSEEDFALAIIPFAKSANFAAAAAAWLLRGSERLQV